MDFFSLGPSETKMYIQRATPEEVIARMQVAVKIVDGAMLQRIRENRFPRKTIH